MITKSFYNFLAKLELNNHKEWFDQNRKEYEEFVKIPFEDFSVELGKAISEFDPEISADYKKNIFRINRDIRFSKDKTPYKTNRSVAYSKNGKKDVNDPGYYVELGINKCYIAGGAWCPSPEKLFKIREEIYYNLDEFNTLLEQKSFKFFFGTIMGTKAKILPKEMKDWAKDSDWIYHKEFYFYHEFDIEYTFRTDFTKQLSAVCLAGLDMNLFLRRAMREE